LKASENPIIESYEPNHQEFNSTSSSSGQVRWTTDRGAGPVAAFAS